MTSHDKPLRKEGARSLNPKFAANDTRGFCGFLTSVKPCCSLEVSTILPSEFEAALSRGRSSKKRLGFSILWSDVHRVTKYS